MAIIIIPPALLEFTDNKSKIEIAGKTLFSALINLTQKYPNMRPHLFDIQGDLTKQLDFYVNKEVIKVKHWQNIPISDQDVISILLAHIKGGKAIVKSNIREAKMGLNA